MHHAAVAVIFSGVYEPHVEGSGGGGGGGVGGGLIERSLHRQFVAGQLGGVWLQLELQYASVPADAPIQEYELEAQLVAVGRNVPHAARRSARNASTILPRASWTTNEGNGADCTAAVNCCSVIRRKLAFWDSGDDKRGI